MTWGGNSMSAEWILSEVKGYKYISFDLYCYIFYWMITFRIM